jgi:hypothetical protein
MEEDEKQDVPESTTCDMSASTHCTYDDIEEEIRNSDNDDIDIDIDEISACSDANYTLHTYCSPSDLRN